LVSRDFKRNLLFYHLRSQRSLSPTGTPITARRPPSSSSLRRPSRWVSKSVHFFSTPRIAVEDVLTEGSLDSRLLTFFSASKSAFLLPQDNIPQRPPPSADDPNMFPIFFLIYRGAARHLFSSQYLNFCGLERLTRDRTRTSSYFPVSVFCICFKGTIVPHDGGISDCLLSALAVTHVSRQGINCNMKRSPARTSIWRDLSLILLFVFVLTSEPFERQVVFRSP